MGGPLQLYFVLNEWVIRGALWEGSTHTDAWRKNSVELDTHCCSVLELFLKEKADSNTETNSHSLTFIDLFRLFLHVCGSFCSLLMTRLLAVSRSGRTFCVGVFEEPYGSHMSLPAGV